MPSIGDHIAYRYEVLDTLGNGSFGKVFKVLDHKRKTKLAIKIIKNSKKLYKQAQVEIQNLKNLKDKSRYIVRIVEQFEFRGHVCIVFELLGENLYEILSSSTNLGLGLPVIRTFAQQLLKALTVQHRLKIIHCDLKPENILMSRGNSVKLIDYGSSCLQGQSVYDYIQSRFYRAPEVLLGVEYTVKIDLWSLGCILVELYTGSPLF